MKKYKFVFLCYIVLLTLLLFSLWVSNKEQCLETFNINSKSETEITNELIIALFIETITNDITSYYSEYYLGKIEVYNYEVNIVNIEKNEPGLISIKFGITPQIGAHNPLGYDELTYSVDSRGNKSLIAYEHLKNYKSAKSIAIPCSVNTNGNFLRPPY